MAARKTPAKKKTGAKKPAAPKKAPAKTAPKAAAGPSKTTPRKKATGLKTAETDASVEAFLENLDPAKREDAATLDRLFREITGETPRMWGAGLVGYGRYHYVYDSGREGDWPITGFAPRKQNLTVYLMDGFLGRQAKLAKLGKHKTGRSCLYLKRLADVDLAVLESLIRESVAAMRAKYG